MSVPRRRSVKRKAQAQAQAQPARSAKSARSVESSGSAKSGGRAKSRGRAKSAGNSAFPEVEQLVELMDRHGLLEVDWEIGGDGTRRVRVSRVGHAPAAGPVHVGLAPMTAAQSAAASSGAAALAQPAKAVQPPAQSTEGLRSFKSPMVGTFYRAPSPEAAPFISVGDKIDEHTTVCIIEAMKVMNEITPDVSGEVVSIEVENGEAVEFGQPLFLIRPL
jgi:acetyl-CoA carboxylase biotin carboxyl carrier protein